MTRILSPCPLALLILTAGFAPAAFAASDARCSARNPAVRDTGSSIYFTTGGALLASLDWEVDATNLDNTPLRGGPFANSERKFGRTAPPNSRVAGRIFGGPTTIGVGTGRFGSTTAHAGGGSSTVTSLGGFDLYYTASWWCTATSVLGTPPAGARAVSEGYTKGTDPWYFTRADDFRGAGLREGGLMDLFVPFQIDSATFDAGGAAEYHVAVETAAGTSPWMSIRLSDAGVDVSLPGGSGLKVYLLPGLDADLNNPPPPIQADDLAQMLAQSLNGGRSLNQSFTIGLELQDMPVPRGAIPHANGSAFAVDISTTATCFAQAEIPTPGAALALALAGLGTIARRKRA